MNAIEVRDLCKSFPGFTLDHLSLNLPSGCIMGLIGENGAGKSTMIKLLLDMLHRDSGTITLLGKDNRDDLKLTKEDIGVVPDEVGIPECLTAGQVGKIMKCTFHHWDDEAWKRNLRTLAIPDGKKFKDFSRGTKMKLGIAIALSHNARLLLLDEATSGLDPVVRDEVLQILNEFTRDETHSVLISSHIVSDLERICDYVAFLHKGKLLICEEKDQLMEKYCVLHCTAEQLKKIPPWAVIASRESGYGTEAIVAREARPDGAETSPVSLEQLFVSMIKGGIAK